MKKILKFNMPKDQFEFDMANQGAEWWNVCWAMDLWLRNKIKYAPDDMTEAELIAYEKSRAHLKELISDANLNLDQ